MIHWFIEMLKYSLVHQSIVVCLIYTIQSPYVNLVIGKYISMMYVTFILCVLGGPCWWLLRCRWPCQVWVSHGFHYHHALMGCYPMAWFLHPPQQAQLHTRCHTVGYRLLHQSSPWNKCPLGTGIFIYSYVAHNYIEYCIVLCLLHYWFNRNCWILK